MSIAPSSVSQSTRTPAGDAETEDASHIVCVYPSESGSGSVPLSLLNETDDRNASRERRAQLIDAKITAERIRCPILVHEWLLKRVCRAWRSVSRARDRSAHLLLLRGIGPTHAPHVLVRRPRFEARSPSVDDGWRVPTVDDCPKPRAAASRVFGPHLAMGAAWAAEMQRTLTAGRAAYASRHAFDSQAHAFAMWMVGPVLKSCDVEWAWVPASDAVQLPTSSVASSLAMRDAVYRATAIPPSTENCMPQSQLGGVCNTLPVLPRHLCTMHAQTPREHSSERSRCAPIKAVALQLTPPAVNVLTRIAVDHAAVAPSAFNRVDEDLIRQVIEVARSRAASRGSSSVASRDVADAASTLVGTRTRRTSSPADHVPEHYEQLTRQLSRVHSLVLRHRGVGFPAPRVLVTGETSGVVAGMFQMAGADVATCDIQPTEHPSIPHFQGDAIWIQDLGWDLVISHPACTYLSNAGLTWLHREEGRVQHMVEATSQYRARRNAMAPFVATENPKMHRHSRALIGHGPTQYVQPWQHGTPHTKATGLDLSPNLPPLQPTCIVKGREHAMANLPASPDRGQQRSKTYQGIAAAMATQWMPVLVEAAEKTGIPSSPTTTAQQLIEIARGQHAAHNQICFVTVHPDTGTQYVLVGGSNGRYKGFTGSRHEGEGKVRQDQAVCKMLSSQIKLSTNELREVAATVRAMPLGHAVHAGQERHDPGVNSQYRVQASHVWSIAVLPKRSIELKSGMKHAEWVPLDEYIRHLRLTGRKCQAAAVSEAVSYATPCASVDAIGEGGGLVRVAPTVVTPTRAIPTVATAMRPWTYPPREVPAQRELPVSQIHRHRHGWRAWKFDTDVGRYRWSAVAKSVADALEKEYPKERSMVRTASIAEEPKQAEPSLMQRVHQVRHAVNVNPLWHYARDHLWERLQCYTDLAHDSDLHGLGSAGHQWQNPPLPSVNRRACAIREQYMQSFVSASVAPTTDVDAAKAENERTVARVAVPIPSKSDDYLCNCLYVSDVTVCTRTGNKYSINVAMAVQQALADTGAGPSVITTDLLELLPNNACVDRDWNDDGLPPPVGPDGQPLRTNGHATLSFEIAGVQYTHRFQVVCGKPLLLLGNDFLNAYQAVISLNFEGTGGSRIELLSMIDGVKTWHRVEATVNPMSTRRVSSVAPATASTDPVDDTAPTAQRNHVSVPEPLPRLKTPTLTAEELAKEHLEIDSQSYALYTEKAVTIPPRSKVTVWARVPLCLQGQHTSCLIDRLPPRPGLEDPPLVEMHPVTIRDDHRVPVVVWNRTKRSSTIPAHSPLAEFDVESEVMVNGRANTATATYDSLTVEQKALIDSIKVDPNAVLSEEQKVRVRDMLARRIGAFAIDPKSPNHTHLMEVTLPLKPDAVPHRHPPSRVGEAGREIIEKHVAEMEAKGIIRKSNSEWSSRIVLVKKKPGLDGTPSEARFCIDFRDLNSKLKYLDSPIPLTVEAIDKLSSGQGRPDSLFLSTLDLASGFWCLPIRESDRELTAFSTGRQKYEFNYLPFGVQSGPSYMCRLMDAVLQGLAWETCIPYLDDVGVWSTGSAPSSLPPEEALRIARDNSFEQMMQRMDMVFERLIWAQLSCKASKCVLFATETEYLGHVIGRDGLKMDPKKISAVSKIDGKSIDTLERVRSFLGLCSYYRRFIPKFSQIAAPLTDLTKKGVDVLNLSQTDKCQDAIEKLKLAITSEPVLATPRFDRQFVVKTDGAQTEGIGGVLGQEDDDAHERVIAYYGRRLQDAERNYTITEIELLAALESIRNWRPYLWGRHFKLVVDHAALKWLHSMRDTIEGGPASRLMRWVLKLSEYDFEVEHKAGAKHCDADGISRLVAAVFAHRAAAQDRLRCQADVAGPYVAPVLRLDRMPRKPTTTARRIQAKDRAERNSTMGHDAVIDSYVPRGLSAEAMVAAQRRDVTCQQLAAWLESRQPPAVTDRASMLRTRWILNEARHTRMIDGVLHHTVPGTQASLPFVPDEMREPLMSAFHYQLGHAGAVRVFDMLRTRYYWPGMRKDIDVHVAECHECTLAKPPPRRARTARPPKVGTYPFDLLFCDIVDMEETHDYDDKGKGYSKLIVFVDSLSRWVEAVPCHGAPTSEQVLDAFLTHVVCRHGAPRELRSDLGSNLAGQLNQIIYDKTGVTLVPSVAEHHEALGTVERFQQTLIRMTRASDEGGKYWVSHLPFLLMSYHATRHRVTRRSPAEILYGREIRLPAQIGTEMRSAPAVTADSPASAAAYAYATRLNTYLRDAWNAAHDVSVAEQAHTVSDTARKGIPTPEYQVNDRVCRRLHDQANKLQYIWSGPYRVAELLSKGRVRLTDLENNILHDEFDAVDLRPYRTHVDAEALQPDEYLVDELIKHRDTRGTREFLVKWRGYPRSQATWEPKSSITRRCAKLVSDYESVATPVPAPPQPPRNLNRIPAPPPVVRQPPVVRSPDQYQSDDKPSIARFARGKWTYGRQIATPRGRRLQWFAASHFTDDELSSECFSALRVSADAQQASVYALLSQYDCAQEEEI